MLAIVQSRLSSVRLPGKVLMPVYGKPILAYLIERLRRSKKLDQIVVATSTGADDDPIEEFCQQQQIRCQRGSLNDVLGRLLQTAIREERDAFVRINGDSPLMDPCIIDRVVTEFELCSADLATNVFPRSFPKGQSVEVVSTAALCSVATQPLTPEDREHVTRYFYSRPDQFRIRNVANDLDLSNMQMSIDTPEDLALFQRVVLAMTRDQAEYGIDELVGLLIPTCKATE